MALYIFSDAHLGSGTPEQTRERLDKIAELVELVKADGDRLIINGDLFDFWFEYKHAIPKVPFEIFAMLTDLVKHGVSVDYVSGNHDFWLDDYIPSLGINVHRDFLDLEYNGKKIFCIHGDGLAKADRGYRFLKRILRNRLNIWLYRKLPPDWGIPLAKFVSGNSRNYTQRRDHSFAPDYEAYAERKLGEGYDIVAIGHLHIPVEKKFGDGLYLNTGDFIHHFSYAKIDAGSASLLYLNDVS